MISKIFKSVFCTTILVLAIGLCASVAFSSFMLLRSDTRALANYTDSLATLLNSQSVLDLSLLDINAYRITLIHPDGVVYYDSKFKTNVLENHADRDEFKDAMQNGKSESFRYSSTLKNRTIYCAVKLHSGDVLRCSYTTDNIISETLTLSFLILIILALAVLVSLFLARKLSKHIVNPINDIDLNHPIGGVVYEELKPLLGRIDSHQHQIKKLLRKVSASHYQMKAMTSNMSEGIIFFNKKTELILINESAKHIFNIKDEKLDGKCFIEIKTFSCLSEVFEQRIEKEQIKTEIEISGKFYSLIFNTIIGKNKLIGFVFLFVDITQSRELQMQKQDFASNVSHELKTPLQSIIGRAELIENGIVKANDLKDFGAKIKSEGKSLLNMINDIMFLSRIESGVKNESEEVNLKALSQSVIDTLQEKAQSHNVVLNLDADEIYLNCVRRYYKEIMTNLVDNAIKYNRENGSVTLRVHKIGSNLAIVVSDTGIGIPKEDLGRIFERFFCVDRSHSNKDSTGLGLTIVKHIVERIGGKLSVESEFGVGTTFKILVFNI